jgi:two-component system cell cycle sensor histidine kinase/response regulator CckA
VHTGDTVLPTGDGELILLVDDEEAVNNLAKTTLENYGYRVLSASNGLEAIAFFEQHKMDVKLVITDSEMPFLDGLSALRTIRELAPDLPALVASGTKDSTDRIHRAELGRVRTLSKPYDVTNLLVAVSKALRN